MPSLNIEKKNQYSKDYDKALYRLTTIFCKLQAGESLSVKELAEEFNVSERTIQKDLNERLSHLNIEKCTDGRYRLPEHVRRSFGNNILDEFIREYFIAMSEGFDEAIREPIFNILGKKSNEVIVTSNHTEHFGDFIKNLIFIYQSIKQQQTICFQYKVNKEYEVDPYKIAMFDGYWYLIGWDRKDRKIKTFYLKEISHLLSSPYNYLYDESIDKEISHLLNNIDSPWVRDIKMKVSITIKGDAMKYFLRKTPHNIKIIEQTKNALLCELEYYHLNEAKSLIYKWIPNIIVNDRKSELYKLIKKEVREYGMGI